MARYQTTLGGWTIYDRETDKFFPANSAVPEYQEFLEWIRAGNTPDEPDPHPHETAEDRVQTKKIVRGLKQIIRWIKRQDSNANVDDI